MCKTTLLLLRSFFFVAFIQKQVYGHGTCKPDVYMCIDYTDNDKNEYLGLIRKINSTTLSTLSESVVVKPRFFDVGDSGLLKHSTPYEELGHQMKGFDLMGCLRKVVQIKRSTRNNRPELVLFSYNPIRHNRKKIYKILARSGVRSLGINSQKIDFDFDVGLELKNVCERKLTCSTTMRISNAERKSLELCKNTLVHHDCRINCRSGYRPSQALSECLPDGTWSKNSCVQAFCEFPPHVKHSASVMFCYKQAENAVCQIRCNEGYKKVGRDYVCVPDSEKPQSPKLRWAGDADCLKNICRIDFYGCVRYNSKVHSLLWRFYNELKAIPDLLFEHTSARHGFDDDENSLQHIRDRWKTLSLSDLESCVQTVIAKKEDKKRTSTDPYEEMPKTVLVFNRPDFGDSVSNRDSLSSNILMRLERISLEHSIHLSYFDEEREEKTGLNASEIYAAVCDSAQ